MSGRRRAARVLLSNSTSARDAGFGRPGGVNSRQWAALFTRSRFRCSTTLIPTSSPPRRSATSTAGTTVSTGRRTTSDSLERLSGGPSGRPTPRGWRSSLQALAAGAADPVAPSRNRRTVISATSAAGMPSAGLRPMACSVSETQPGETALTRTEIDGLRSCCANEPLDSGVDGGDDRAAGGWILRRKTSRQGGRAAGAGGTSFRSGRR